MLNTIYKITNDINGKVYIGKTSLSIDKRFKQHVLDSNKNRCNKRPLYDAMNKYGVENFHIEVIEENISDEDINDKEIYYIRKYNSYIGFNNTNGYNATLGGDSRKYKNIDIEKISSDYAHGMNCTDIGKKYHVDSRYIANLLRSNGVHVLNPVEFQSKPIYQIDKLTNLVISKYESATEAAIKLFGDKRKRSNISKVLAGSQTSAFGFRWVYCD